MFTGIIRKVSIAVSEDHSRNSRLKGLVLTTVGVFLVIPDSLFVRLIEAEPMVIAFWRSLTSGLIILLAILAVQGQRGFGTCRSMGLAGVAYIVLIGSTSPGFVLAITHTSVANVMVIVAAMPLFAALFGRLFLNEPITSRLVVTMIFVLIGVAILAYGSGSTARASWQGDLWAVYVTMAFAGALTALRKIKDISMIPAIPIAYLGAALALAPFITPWPAFQVSWPLFLGHGIFMGAAACLLALGPRFISAAEVSLLILLESVLAPVLVWWVIGEHPGPWALAGGSIVIATLLISNLVSFQRRQAQISDRGD